MKQFIPAKGVIAEVKETLRSYFSTGVIDDVLFPTWIADCNNRLGNTAYQLTETVLTINNYVADLPPDFKSVREAWMSTTVGNYLYPLPSSTYITRDYVIDRYAEEAQDRCYQCDTTPCCCMDDCQIIRKITTKSNDAILFQYQHCFPLRAATASTINKCCPSSINRVARCAETFEIKDCQFVTNFETGLVALTYYADPGGCADEMMILDNQWVKEFIRAHLIYMCYDQLFHQVTDETFNQVARKRDDYRLMAQNAYVTMETKLKLPSRQQDIDRMRRAKTRYSRFNINF